MEWSDLRIFLAVARARTLGAAGRALGLTQPTMGRRLRALEAAVGHALFQRTSEGFLPTDEGTALLGHAERIEAEVLAAERVLAGQEHELEGTVRVASSDWFGTHLLTPVFADFAAKHPRVTIELLTDPRMMRLSRREADLAFRIQRFDEPEVVEQKLMHMPYAVYGAVGSTRPRLGDGTGTALVTMDTGFDQFPDAVWLRASFPNARVAFRSNNRDVQARAAASGLGFCVLPRPLGDELLTLARFDFDEAPPGRDVWVGYHRDLARVGRLRALLDATIAALGSRKKAGSRAIRSNPPTARSSKSST